MIRLSNIKLPLDHTEQDLANALISTLEITAEQLIAFNVFVVVLMRVIRKKLC